MEVKKQAHWRFDFMFIRFNILVAKFNLASLRFNLDGITTSETLMSPS